MANGTYQGTIYFYGADKLDSTVVELIVGSNVISQKAFDIPFFTPSKLVVSKDRSKIFFAESSIGRVSVYSTSANKIIDPCQDYRRSGG